jgi:hypothetical protein
MLEAHTPVALLPCGRCGFAVNGTCTCIMPGSAAGLASYSSAAAEHCLAAAATVQGGAGPWWLHPAAADAGARGW